ncbi:unnamed protein product [Camellia sinensis]
MSGFSFSTDPSSSSSSSSTTLFSTSSLSSSSSFPFSNPTSSSSFPFSFSSSSTPSSVFASSIPNPNPSPSPSPFSSSASASASAPSLGFGLPNSAASTPSISFGFGSSASAAAASSPFGTPSSFGSSSATNLFGSTTSTSVSTSTPPFGSSLGDGVPTSTSASVVATSSNASATVAQTSMSLTVASSSGTATTVSAVTPAPKLPSEITGKTVEEIIKEWNSELQERTGKFRKQANAIAEWDRRILQNRDILLRLESEVAKVVETQANVERQLELIETHQLEVDKALQSIEEEAERIYKDEHNVLLDDEAASTRDAMYEQAEVIEREQEQMAEQIKTIIQILNANQGGELDTIDGMTPLDVVVRILNNQLSSLMWIDEKAEEFSSRIQKLASQGSAADRELMEKSLLPEEETGWQHKAFVLFSLR